MQSDARPAKASKPTSISGGLPMSAAPFPKGYCDTRRDGHIRQLHSGGTQGGSQWHSVALSGSRGAVQWHSVALSGTHLQQRCDERDHGREAARGRGHTPRESLGDCLVAYDEAEEGRAEAERDLDGRE